MPYIHTSFQTIMRRFIFALAACLLLLPAAPGHAQSPSRAALVASIDSLLSRELAAPAAGFQVAVVKGRDTLVMKSYGFANVELQVPATTETLFRIGSVTKQFTATAVMQLAEQGKLRLTDSLAKFLPNIPPHWRGVTIRHLLNHTSGIPAYSDLGARARPLMMLGAPRDSMIAFLRNDSLLFSPGSGFYYNNTGYYLLGMVIEQVSGKSYAAYINDNLAVPLGLAHTRYCGTRAVLPNRASGYDRSGTSLVNAAYIDMETPYAAGSLCSTARDLVLWGAALASGRVISRASYEEMTIPITLASPRPMTYGYGFFVAAVGSYRVLEHPGNIPGFAAHLMRVPSESLYVAVTANTASSPAPQMAYEIARIVLAVPRTVAVPTLRDDPLVASARDAYIGRYALTQADGSKVDVSIIARDGCIAFQGLGQDSAPLLWQGGDLFVVRGQPIRFYFARERGRVTGFVFERGVRPLPARRVSS